jgi:hypothetical protein
MSDAELVIVLVAAAILILAVCLSSLRRRRLNRADYWLPDGTRFKRALAVSAEWWASVTFMQ